jgi:RNA polymerase sigma-70 factor (ECF subfamily)
MYMTPKQETQLREMLTVAHNDYQKGLNAYAFFKIHDHATSQDLVQDTFLKTWKYLVKVGKIDIMKAFLYHVLNNLIVDEYRKRKASSLEVLIDNGFEPVTTDTGQLFTMLDGKAALEQIQRLPTKYQHVMRLRYVQSLSLKEISLITGQTPNTIAVQVHRGVKKLRLLHGN